MTILKAALHENVDFFKLLVYHTSMTTDEFDRILTSLRHTTTLNVDKYGYMVTLRAVVEILHSQLNYEDKGLYSFDFNNNLFKKKELP